MENRDRHKQTHGRTVAAGVVHTAQHRQPDRPAAAAGSDSAGRSNAVDTSALGQTDPPDSKLGFLSPCHICTDSRHARSDDFSARTRRPVSGGTRRPSPAGLHWFPSHSSNSRASSGPGFCCLTLKRLVLAPGPVCMRRGLDLVAGYIYRRAMRTCGIVTSLDGC